jgi:D-alanyl-D-alanine carboxypeptidase
MRQHAGHIPGYVSSLRHYSELGATIAFQVNTDIGMIDGSENPIPVLEQELARILKGWLN